MNIRLVSLVALALLSAPAWAGSDGSVTSMNPIVSTGRIDVDMLAHEAGVTSADVRMVLGARTPFAQYRVNYDRTEARVAAAAERILYAQRNDRSQQQIASLARP